MFWFLERVFRVNALPYGDKTGQSFGKNPGIRQYISLAITAGALFFCPFRDLKLLFHFGLFVQKFQTGLQVPGLVFIIRFHVLITPILHLINGVVPDFRFLVIVFFTYFSMSMFFSS